MIASNIYKEHLAKGKRGIVSLVTRNGKHVVLKEKNPRATINTLAHEANMLLLVNKHGIGPRFIEFDENGLFMEHIEGERILRWVSQAQKRDIKLALLNILTQCRELDILGINKFEMTHPYKHIIMRGSRPVFIDFERCRRSEHPKNVTQVCQWFTGTELRVLLQKKDMIIDRAVMLAHAKAYKTRADTRAYERIRGVIAHA